MKRKGLITIATLVLIIVIIIVIIIRVVRAKTEIKCMFCDKKALHLRKPDHAKIEHYRKFDLEPSYAELLEVYVCDDCKAIAGGFRTTTWFSLS